MLQIIFLVAQSGNREIPTKRVPVLCDKPDSKELSNSYKESKPPTENSMCNLKKFFFLFSADGTPGRLLLLFLFPGGTAS